MKLRVAKKDEFDRWFNSFELGESSHYGEDRTHWTDVEKLLSSSFSYDYHFIDVEPSLTIKQLIDKLTGCPPVTISKSNLLSKQLPIDSETREITERYIYCLMVSTKELNPEKRLSDYPIEENDILLLGEYTRVEPDPCMYRAVLIRDITDFSSIIRTQQDIIDSPELLFRPPPPPKGATEALLASIMVGSMFHGSGLRPVEGILLHTDEDTEIAKYIRYNFASIDVMTGHHLNLYVIEQPMQVKGVSPRVYWKAYLDDKVFSVFQLLGWAKSKPYDKSSAYRIAEMLGLYPEVLPCIVFFGNIKGDEKIAISITEDCTTFFRTLSSIVCKTIDELLKSKRELYSFSEFKRLFLSKWEIFMDTQLEKPSNIFTFNGNTVFINRPKGPFKITDFQKGE